MGDRQSIIPNALKVAKAVGDRVTVVHPVDSRKQHAVSSAYADSQSFERGAKLSYEETLQKEVQKAGSALDILLSKEASKLNFPLRVGTLIEACSLTDGLQTAIGGRNMPLIMASTVPDGDVIDNLEEYFVMMEYFGGHTLLLPPDFEWVEEPQVMMVHDIEADDHEYLINLLNMFKPLKMSTRLIDVSHVNDFSEKEIRDKVLCQHVNNVLGDTLAVDSRLLKGEDYSATIMEYFRENTFDWIMLPRFFSPDKGMAPFPNELHKKALKELNVPVLFYT